MSIHRYWLMKACSLEDAIHIIQERAADLINIKQMSGPVYDGSRIRMNDAWGTGIG